MNTLDPVSDSGATMTRVATDDRTAYCACGPACTCESGCACQDGAACVPACDCAA